MARTTRPLPYLTVCLCVLGWCGELLGQQPYEGLAVAEDGVVVVQPGTVLPLDPDAMLTADAADPVFVENQLFANGLVVPAGYRCPSEGHCDVPCIACRQAQFSGWSAAVDLMIYTPMYAGGSLSFIHPDDGSDVSVGPRLTIRHEHDHGGGIEARFSGVGFDELVTRDTSSGVAYLPTELQTFQFDLDFTQRVWIGDSSVVFGVGPRAASLGLTLGTDPEMTVNTGGVGFSASLDRPFFRTNNASFSFVGYGRASLMGGNVEQPADSVIADGTLSILETGFGIELRRRVGRGDFLGRIMYESQWWESNIMAPIYLEGPSIRLGYQW